MIDSFKLIKPEEIQDNPFKLVGSDWMLITAGSPDSFNTMTASWGGFGVIWNKNICWCVIRPQRYTFEFIERAETFTLSFFSEKYKQALTLCGTRSGRDIAKASAAGLTPIAGRLQSATCFAEARMVLECRKLYYQDITPGNFIDPAIEDNYPDKDYHRMYMGEVVYCGVQSDQARMK